MVHRPPVPRTWDLPVEASMSMTQYRSHSVISSASVTVLALSPVHISCRPLVVTPAMSVVGHASTYLLSPMRE